MVWGDGDTVRDPQGTTYPADNRSEGSAVEQMGSPDSLYSYYKRLILLRKANPEIACGDYKALALSDTKVGGFTASRNGKSCLVLHNTTGSAATLELGALGLAAFTEISGFAGRGTATLDGGVLTLEAQTSVVLR